MVEKSDEVGKLCRFCLSREGLIALSNVTSTVVALEDVIYFTGVEKTLNVVRKLRNLQTLFGAMMI
ncbi:AGAP012753-PA-like protein [Anopheles sinensis]|uniref:AGAP012753-PA-like protein n=1 Tax=Anopheles sinensis TaxID=74873 RepID=A0A084VN68_ANOSI|nr:AGAP012753-PA-like protein [Anopheles sinensis]